MQQSPCAKPRVSSPAHPARRAVSAPNGSGHGVETGVNRRRTRRCTTGACPRVRIKGRRASHRHVPKTSRGNAVAPMRFRGTTCLLVSRTLRHRYRVSVGLKLRFKQSCPGPAPPWLRMVSGKPPQGGWHPEAQMRESFRRSLPCSDPCKPSCLRRVPAAGACMKSHRWNLGLAEAESRPVRQTNPQALRHLRIAQALLHPFPRGKVEIIPGAAAPGLRRAYRPRFRSWIPPRDSARAEPLAPFPFTGATWPPEGDRQGSHPGGIQREA